MSTVDENEVTSFSQITSVTSTGRNLIAIKSIIKQLDDCPVRIIGSHPPLEGQFGNAKEKKSGQIFYEGKWYSTPQIFCQEVGKLTVNRTYPFHGFLEVFVNDEWMNASDLIQHPDFAQDVSALNPHLRKFFDSERIVTISDLYSHELLKYKIKRDAVTDQIIPLLRTCEKRPESDIIRNFHIDESNVINYCMGMATHIRTGTRKPTKPFISATLSVDVAKFWSCGFLKPVIVIDQIKVKDRSIFIGGEPGQHLYPEGPMLNFAVSSKEVLIASRIGAQEYDVVEPEFTLKHEWVSVDRRVWPGPRQLHLNHLLASGIIKSLGNGKGGIVKVEWEGKSYVVKVGPQTAESPDLHVQNEFLALCLYSCLGVPVPKCVLQSYDVVLKSGESILHRTSLYYLIHEYVEGSAPLIVNFRIESQTILTALVKHTMADILLCNFDVMTVFQQLSSDRRKQQALANIIMHDDKAYRIDAGGALYLNPNGTFKAKDKSVTSIRLKDVIDHMKLYFKKKESPGQTANDKSATFIREQLKSKLNDRAISKQFNECKRLFRENIKKFRDLNKKLMLPGWDDVVSAVHERLAVCLNKDKWDISEDISAPEPSSEQLEQKALPPPAPERNDSVSVQENEIIIIGILSKKIFPDNHLVVDVTAKHEGEYVQLSPCYAFEDENHRPAFAVPGLDGRRSYTVEGMWQGLKMFESAGIDEKKFTIQNRKNFKRSGRLIGYFGGEGKPMLQEIEARKQIYLPAYEQMLDMYASEPLEQLFQEHVKRGLVLKDHFVNEDVENDKTQLSHASLIKKKLQSMFQDRFRGHTSATAATAGAAAGGESATLLIAPTPAPALCSIASPSISIATSGSLKLSCVSSSEAVFSAEAAEGGRDTGDIGDDTSHSGHTLPRKRSASEEFYARKATSESELIERFREQFGDYVIPLSTGTGFQLASGEEVLLGVSVPIHTHPSSSARPAPDFPTHTDTTTTATDVEASRKRKSADDAAVHKGAKPRLA